MISKTLFIYLMVSCISAQSEEPTTGTGVEETGGTVDPNQPQGAAAPTPLCKVNETYRVCGTACELSCDNPLPVPCISLCVRGCQCNSGYYRNKQGNCVLLKDCPSKPFVCNLFCIKGYICEEVNGKAACVPVPKCKTNESYQPCGSVCEPTCDRPTPGICQAMCVPGCRCDNGYVRNNNGDCVKGASCPPKDPTDCQNKKCPPPQTCAIVLPPLCPVGHCSPQPTCVSYNPCLWTKCKAGQECVLRPTVCAKPPCNPVPECVPGQTCPINEEYTPCKNACSEKGCRQLPVVCLLVCTGSGGCICKTGYYRNSSGKCVTCNSTIG